MATSADKQALIFKRQKRPAYACDATVLLAIE